MDLKPSPIQCKAIAPMLSERDIIAQARSVPAKPMFHG